MKRVILVTVAVLATFAAGQASAAPVIEFQLLEARWENPVGGANVTITPPSPGFGDPATITWGDGFAPDSGYVFDARNTPFSAGPNVLFDLGDFTHNNFPIPLVTSITGVDLRLRGNIEVTNSGGSMQTFLGQEFLFNFAHYETLNGANPCANGGANGVGVNVNGCADIVTISGLPGDSNFLVDGELFTLNIDGFQIGGSPVSQFETAENQANTATLRASFRAVAVPEPGTLALFIFGSAGFGLMGWRRRGREALAA